MTVIGALLLSAGISMPGASPDLIPAHHTRLIYKDFPAMLVVEGDAGFSTVLNGTLRGYINGSADFWLEGPVLGRCRGEVDPKGHAQMSCANGFSYAGSSGPQRRRFSGVWIATGRHDNQGYVAGFGWGRRANETDIRNTMKGRALTK